MRQLTTRPAWSLALFVIILASLVVAACRPVAPAPAAAEPLDPAAAWQRIVDEGKIVVGTSADYPPFEYYNEAFQIDGFDPALMRAIAAEMGIEVEFRDMAFDGLGGALVLGQVDAVIAAVSQTPERARLVDFTNTYFVSSDGYLAAKDSTIEVNSLDDLKGLRVGVQRGSIYEDQVQKTLVDSGLIDQRNVILYEDVAAAVKDLDQALIDVIVLDLPAAEKLAASGDTRIAGRGINQQRYAIAVPKGSTELLDGLNAGLAAVQSRGGLARLAEQYLGIAATELQPLPSEPVAPAAGAAPELKGCIDSMAWVADLSYDDQDMTAPPVMFPGQPFTKSWRIQNTGTCTWDSTYFLTFSRGNAPGASMGGSPVNIRGSVAPGQTYDISVDLVAPLVPGIYQGFWEMHTAAGRAFGETLWVGVQVAGSPTPTPAPTQTPVPGVVFYADATNIVAGQAVTFFWQVENAQEVYFYREGEEWTGAQVEPTGQQTVTPDRSTTYNLRVVTNDGAIEVRSIPIEVAAGAGPVINVFAVAPNGQVPLDTCIDITWQVDGDAPAITLTRNDVALWEEAPVQGNLQDCLKTEGEYVYTIAATNAEGEDTRIETVVVTANAKEPQPASDAPVIDAFAVTPDSVPVNGCVTVDWSVGGNVQTIRILRDDAVILDNAPLTGSGQNCLTDAGTYDYRIEAASPDGATVSADVTVTAVTPEPTDAPPANAGAADAELTAQSWTLISMFDGAGAMVSPLEGSQITAQFDADGTLSGLAGCNNYSSGYTAGDGIMTISPPAATMKFCSEPAGVMDQEALYLSLLPTVATYVLEDGQLTLSSGNGQQLAVFVAEE